MDIFANSLPTALTSGYNQSLVTINIGGTILTSSTILYSAVVDADSPLNIFKSTSGNYELLNFGTGLAKATVVCLIFESDACATAAPTTEKPATSSAKISEILKKTYGNSNTIGSVTIDGYTIQGIIKTIHAIKQAAIGSMPVPHWNVQIECIGVPQ